MVENYLQEARRHFELDLESKRRQREEREEAEERRKREIYLNGGYRDCATPGCSERAAAQVDAGSEGKEEDDDTYLCRLFLTIIASHELGSLP